MKKIVTAFLLTCSCVLAGAAVACKDEKPTVLGDPRSVSFTSGEGYVFYSNASADGTIAEGSQLTFEIELGAFYAGNLTAYVNETIVNPDKDGVYSYTVGKDDLSIRVEGVRKDVSNMTGSGTLEDAYVVSKPIDLVYIAEQVNKGNRDYATAAYVLANDIDCKGEELKIIGDYKTESAVFCGSFASGTNAEGERERYTISNFTINSNDSNYVGLFGAVRSDMTVQSSGLIYGICLDNFTVSATVNGILSENKTISCGSLVGYGVGANFYLCEATNGEVNVVADNNYFSFVGGLVGYQQGFFNPSYDMYLPTEISYAKVDVDVNILGGVALCAGGITGYATTNYPYNATAAIHNSYALGSVSGALRSGGVVGGLGQFSVVSNCYATGEITARSYQPIDSLLLTSTEYCHAYAGGIVGYAENETIAHDSFFNGSVSASTASDKIAAGYAHSDNAIGGGDEAGTVSVDGAKYIAYNCQAGVDLSNSAYFTDTLGWGSYNWNFKDGALPVINYNQTEATITLNLTLKYVTAGGTAPVAVKGRTELTQKYFDTSISSLNSYNPLGTFIASGSLENYYQADDPALRSYGYYFDAACTQKVPAAYMPMQDVTLYVAFTSPAAVLGSYSVFAQTNTDELTLTLHADGTATYADGSTKLDAYYGYDGKRVILENVRLARYFNGAIEIDEEDTTSLQDPNFDLNRYGLYNFAFVPVDGNTAHLFDGNFFTAENPLVAKKTTLALRGEYYETTGSGNVYYFFYGDKALVRDAAGETEYAVTFDGTTATLKKGESVKTVQRSALKNYDAFKGSWVKSATINKIYTFDGMGNWSYKQIAYERSLNGYQLTCERIEKDVKSGTYTVDGETLTFVGTGETAKFHNGYLEITSGTSTQAYSAENSFQGKWKGTDFDLSLEGILSSGYGHASVVTKEGFTTKLLYEVSETGSVIALYNLATNVKDKTLYKDSLYGYASYSLLQNTLSFVFPSSETETGYSTASLYLYDDYYGDWVCEHNDLKEVDLTFNGLGLYSYLGVNGLKGSLTLTDGDKKTEIEYQLDSAMSGKFSYGQKTYQLTFDEVNGTVRVEIVGSDDTLLERKDEFAGLELVDITGKDFCEIDGRSTLNAGGVLTFKGTSYRYFPAANGYEVKAKDADTVVGSIVKEGNHYTLTLNGTATELYLANKFMGDWAIGGQYALFEIGPTDLDGVVQAVYKGVKVTLTYLDPATLTFKYKEDKMPYTYYVYVIEDETQKTDALVISEFTNLASGEYFICSKANDLYGTWEWNRDGGKTTMRFDGVTSGYTNGYAELTLTLEHSTIVTPYYYSMRDGGIVFWSRETMADRTWYFRLDEVSLDHKNDEDAFVLKDASGNVVKVLKRTPVDGLYLTEAYGANGEKYQFDGLGQLWLMADGKPTVAKYEYVIKSYNDDRTATLEVLDLTTKIKYTATLDYSDATYVEFILGEEIVAE